jgi:hypothetical protein
MQLQGYVEPIARTQKWRTTEAGLAVSGSKTARLTPEAVEQALSALRDRIQAINNDKNPEYTVSEAVAFGDFLSQDARVQPAEVGIRLTSRNTDVDGSASVSFRRACVNGRARFRAQSGCNRRYCGTGASVVSLPSVGQIGTSRYEERNLLVMTENFDVL